MCWEGTVSQAEAGFALVPTEVNTVLSEEPEGAQSWEGALLVFLSHYT